MLKVISYTNANVLLNAQTECMVMLLLEDVKTVTIIVLSAMDLLNLNVCLVILQDIIILMNVQLLVHMDISKMIPTTLVPYVTKTVVIVTVVNLTNVLNVVKVDTYLEENV